MNLRVEIEDGKNSTKTYIINFTPTEEAIKDVTKGVVSFLKSISPKITKETKSKENLN